MPLIYYVNYEITIKTRDRFLIFENCDCQPASPLWPQGYIIICRRYRKVLYQTQHTVLTQK